jgi:integrase
VSRSAWTIARFETKQFRLADGSSRKRLLLVIKWQGPRDEKPRRHRLSLDCADTRDNRRAWEERRRKIEGHIRAGTFDPKEWLGGRLARRSVPAVLTALERSAQQTFGEAAREWLLELRGEKMTPTTIDQYEMKLNAHLLGLKTDEREIAPDPLAAVPLSELHAGHLKSFRGRLMQKGLETSTVNSIFARIKTITNSAFSRGLIPRPQSPALLVKNLRERVKEVDPFDQDELIRILKSCTTAEQRALYLTMALTGMRPGEALGIAWTAINFADGVLSVRQQLTEDGELTSRLKTPRSRREVEMLPAVADALLAQKPRTFMLGPAAIKKTEADLDRNLIFRNPNRSPLNIRWQDDEPWRRTLARAGVNYRPFKNFRHSYVSFMLSAGKPIQWIAAQVGHVGVKRIDDTYGKWIRTPSNQRLDLDKFFCEIKEFPAAGFRQNSARLAPIKPQWAGENGESSMFIRGICPGRESNPDLRFRRPP